MKDQMSTDELAVLLGVSAQSIRELTRKHILAKVDKSYPVAVSVRGYTKHLREIAAGRSGPSSADLSQARIRKITLEGDLLALKNATESGQMVTVEEADADKSALIRFLRASLLALPSRLSSRLTFLEQGDIALIDEEIREIMTDMSEGKDVNTKEAWIETGAA